MRRSQLFRRVLIAALVPVFLFIALISWSLASPVGASPDDDYHMASIWCGQGVRENLCEEGASAVERRVPATLLQYSGCYAFKPEASASCPQEPSSVLLNTSRGNFDGGYPPVFYGVMSVFAGDSISTSILVMRAVNAFFFLTLTATIFFLLPVARRGPLLWGSIVSLVPLGMFIIPSVNPSSWAVLSAATLWVSLLAYFQAQTRSRLFAFGILAAISTIVGAGARGDSAVYAAIAMVTVFMLAFERTQSFLRRSLLPLGLGLVAVAFFFSAGQSAIVSPDALSEGATRQEVVSLTISNILLLPQLWAGALGLWGLGWLDTTFPGLVWIPALVIFMSTLFWGLRRVSLRKGLALGLVFGCLVLIPLYILVNDRVLVGSGVQPRYIYPLMIMLVGLAVLDLDRVDLGLSRVQLTVVAVCLSIANTVALHVNIRRYVTGTDVGVLDLNKNAEWWWLLPISPMQVWAIGSLSFTLALIGAVFFSVTRSEGIFPTSNVAASKHLDHGTRISAA